MDDGQISQERHRSWLCYNAVAKQPHWSQVLLFFNKLVLAGWQATKWLRVVKDWITKTTQTSGSNVLCVKKRIFCLERWLTGWHWLSFFLSLFTSNLYEYISRSPSWMRRSPRWIPKNDMFSLWTLVRDTFWAFGSVACFGRRPFIQYVCGHLRRHDTAITHAFTTVPLLTSLFVFF